MILKLNNKLNIVKFFSIGILLDIPIEKMTSFSVDYSLTITLRPKCYTKEPEQQFDDTYEHVRRKLYSLTEHFTLVAEVTKSFNVHYHAILKFEIDNSKPSVTYLKEIYKCFRNDDLVGFIKCEQTLGRVSWISYLKKDLFHTYNSINRRPIIYDDYDIFTETDRANYGVTW